MEVIQWLLEGGARAARHEGHGRDRGQVQGYYQGVRGAALEKSYHPRKFCSLCDKSQLIPLQEFFRNTLVTVEIACWFFAGEIIGRSLAAKKWSFYGYLVPGGVKPKRDTLAG